MNYELAPESISIEAESTSLTETERVSRSSDPKSEAEGEEGGEEELKIARCEILKAA